MMCRADSARQIIGRTDRTHWEPVRFAQTPFWRFYDPVRRAVVGQFNIRRNGVPCGRSAAAEARRRPQWTPPPAAHTISPASCPESINFTCRKNASREGLRRSSPPKSSAKQGLRRAIDLNPSFSEAYLSLSQVLTEDGRPNEAIPVLETTMRLSPNSPLGFAAMANLGRAHLHMKEFDEAKRWAEMAIRHSPAADWDYLVLLSSLGHMGLGEEARAVRQTYLLRRPAFSISDVPKRLPYRRQEDVELVSDGLRKAGLPE